MTADHDEAAGAAGGGTERTLLVRSGSPPGDDLGSAVRRGLRWTFGTLVVARLTSITAGIVLARILVPHDYGVFAPALVVVNVLFGLNDLGMLLALVRWQGDLRVAARTAQAVAMATSAALYAGCFLAAPWFARTVGSPSSSAVLRVLAITVFIDGLTTASHALLVRDFQQDRFAKAELAALPVAVVTSLALAAAGADVWSLVVSQILANCVSGVLVVRAAPFRVGLGFSWAVARPMLAYGLPLAATSLVEYALLGADYLVIGHALGPAILGIYVLAFNISSWPHTTITEAVRRVSIAGFARLEGDPASLRRNFTQAFSLLVALALPALVVMAALAEDLVRVLYGGRWAAAGAPLQLLVVLAGARMAIGFVWDLLVGVGRSRTTFLLQLGWFAAVVVALPIGVAVDGIRGAAAAHALVAAGIALPAFLRAAARAGADLAGVRRRLARPAVAAVASTALVLAIRDHLGGPLGTLLGGGAVVALSYAAIAVAPRDVHDLLERRTERLATAGDPR